MVRGPRLHAGVYLHRGCMLTGVYLQSDTKGLNFGLNIHHLPYFGYASSDDSGELCGSGQSPAYAISTIIPCAGPSGFPDYLDVATAVVVSCGVGRNSPRTSI